MAGEFVLWLSAFVVNNFTYWAAFRCRNKLLITFRDAGDYNNMIDDYR
jgi:hypothetical protein